MSGWPTSLRMGPIREWPGSLTPDVRRQRSRFEATMSATLSLLDREVSALRKPGGVVELLVAISADQFRLDGYPRANAKAMHPGVILSIESKHGRLSYPCDTFTAWEDNLRAVALGLEALRKVDRYGITAHGEQYRGFLAIEGSGTGPMTIDVACRAVALLADVSPSTVLVNVAMYVRVAKRNAHPDTGGTAESWHTLVEAERVLREAGRL